MYSILTKEDFELFWSLNKNFKYYFFTEAEIIDCLQLSILSLTGVDCGRK